METKIIKIDIIYKNQIIINDYQCEIDYNNTNIEKIREAIKQQLINDLDIDLTIKTKNK
jgi:hypothetical protein